MLVKFNKFKAMETLSEMIPGEEYDIIVSGELKDGKRFKGSAKITITTKSDEPLRRENSLGN
jgi:hypothetical protein